MRDIIIDKLSKVELSTEDYERARKVVWGNYIRTYNSTESIGYVFVLHLLTKINYFDFKEVYETISFDDIKARKERNLDIKKSALSVVDNIKGGLDA